ncbi:MAG: hypothetical protein P8075_21650 [Deltaproteobacteria bacterium]
MKKRVSPLLGAKEELIKREVSVLSPYATLSTAAIADGQKKGLTEGIGRTSLSMGTEYSIR